MVTNMRTPKSIHTKTHILKAVIRKHTDKNTIVEKTIRAHRNSHAHTRTYKNPNSANSKTHTHVEIQK